MDKIKELNKQRDKLLNTIPEHERDSHTELLKLNEKIASLERKLAEKEFEEGKIKI